jgi:hypothetical protein
MSMNLGRMWSNNKNIIRIEPKIEKKNLVLLNNNAVNNKINKKESNVISQDNRAYWGTPTWILFHTIAEKVNENYYNQNYMVIWNFIKDVCHNLPCPFCQSHAIKYVNSVNISQIKTKIGLKRVLFDFHNQANKNSRKKEESIEILKKYKNANTNNVFNHFETRFFKSYIGNRQFTDWIKNALKTRYAEFVEKTMDYIK